MRKWTKNKLIPAVSTAIMLFAIVITGPLDFFTHGYYCEEVDCGQIAAEDFRDRIPLEDNYYQMAFSPRKKYFAGFEIYLTDQPDNNSGNLILTVLDGEEHTVDTIYADLSKIPENSWYKLHTAAKLKKGKKYTLRFSVTDCRVVPSLQAVEGSYLPTETVSGNILLGYAYAHSTFSFPDKVLIILLIISVWGWMCTFFIRNNYKKNIRKAVGSIFLISIFAWNYMYNSMDNQNETFSEFQISSETLVTGKIYAERHGISFEDKDEQGYGLGRYYDLKGVFDSYNQCYITDDSWLNGYSRTEPAIIIHSNIYSREVARRGNYIAFDQGDIFSITNVVDDGTNIIVYLDSSTVLTSAKYGSLDDATFFDSNRQRLPSGRLTAYVSQYGLQGKIFKRLSRYMDTSQMAPKLNLLCSIATGAVFVLIVYLIAAKYNRILAGCYLVTFWLSPWIVNFARNLYWVEFTWFIPMAIGLFCAWKIENKKCRTACYMAAFISVTGKCLCGYEYISVIMIGLIAFLLVDFLSALARRDNKNAILLFRTVIILGCAALLGFATAICFHASLRGNHDIWVGIKDIFEQDILRRTTGGDLNAFDAELWPSFNASVWEVFCKYFHFQTEIITGLDGNLFPLLCIVPLYIFAYEYRNRELNASILAMYSIFFLASISWFCLAKSHSYIHAHMNYVLWYFGYIQTCLYVIVKKIAERFGLSER